MSQRESGYARKDRDLYETPEWVTEVLCRHLYNSGWMLGCVWEPAAGGGKMLDVLSRYADPGCAIGTDIEPLRDDVCLANFLTDEPPIWRGPFGQHTFGAIVTNPPYDLATEFIERALRYFEGRSVGKIAMLLRTDFDHAKSRTHLFRDCLATHIAITDPEHVGIATPNVDALFGLAAAAPDHGQLNPWRFIVVPVAQRHRLAERLPAHALDQCRDDGLQRHPFERRSLAVGRHERHLTAHAYNGAPVPTTPSP